jgi:hypothetical protein
VLVVAACAALVWVGLASPSAGDPKRRLTPAGDAYARSYVLRTADLPAGVWRAHRASFTEPNPSCIVRHYNLGALTLDGEAGDVYVRGSGLPLVESDAHVFVSAAQARRAFDKESPLGFARCLGDSLAGGNDSDVGVAAMRVGGLAALARGFRIVVRLGSKGDGSTLHAALVVLRHGRAIGVLSVITAGSPWRRPLLRSLSATMARRMARR